MSNLIRTEYENRVVTYESPLLHESGVPHAFTTRLGGLSPKPYESLNLASLAKDPEADANTNVAANFRKVREAIGCQRHIRVQVNQVHGREVWLPPAEPVRPVDAPRADAIATDKQGLLLMVRVADCVPVLLASRDGSVVSAAHAGWRSIVAGVVQNAVEVLTALGEINTGDLLAAVGPCIGTAHFEVGEEVASKLQKVGLGSTVKRDGYAKPHIDLSAAVHMQLKEAGIPTEQIDLSDRCTFAHADEFFSHRRDHGRTGRQAALIAAKPA